MRGEDLTDGQERLQLIPPTLRARPTISASANPCCKTFQKSGWSAELSPWSAELSP